MDSSSILNPSERGLSREIITKKLQNLVSHTNDDVLKEIGIKPKLMYSR